MVTMTRRPLKLGQMAVRPANQPERVFVVGAAGCAVRGTHPTTSVLTCPFTVVIPLASRPGQGRTAPVDRVNSHLADLHQPIINGGDVLGEHPNGRP
jgi:hypothetical protein